MYLLYVIHYIYIYLFIKLNNCKSYYIFIFCNTFSEIHQYINYLSIAM